MLAPPMEPTPTPPPARQTLSLAGAGSVLIGSTLAMIGLGILIGWLFGSVAWGFLVGAILGLPFGVFMTYKRYGHAL
jgi:F0F1-type ATP synthase assembly protein I